jgi:hypothetical protein
VALTHAEKAHGLLTGERLFACVSEHGSFVHTYHSSPELLFGPYSTRNLADAVHFFCSIHGRCPGVIDHAITHSANPVARAWLISMLEGFSVERAFLARLTVEAGPIPSTLGAESVEATLLSQRHALDMLAQSERDGCAIGAAMALIIDWGHIRKTLNAAGDRFEVKPPDFRFTDTSEIKYLADSLGASPNVERALLFGAQQIMLQHHGLWDLLESRQLARIDQ